MPCSDLISRLEGVRRSAEGRWAARCPAHADKRASLSIRELDDGRVLVHCFAGCAVEDVLSACGATFETLFPLRKIEHAVPERRAFPAADVLCALVDELTLISVIAIEMRRGDPISDETYARLQVAIERVQAGRELALGR